MGWARPAPRARQWEGGPITPRTTVRCAADLSCQAVAPLQKSRPTRCESYRRLVAALPCAHCRIAGISQAAHGPTLGAGIKANDLDTFPLCCDQPGRVGCHFKFDQYQLFAAAERAAQAEKWATQTRALLFR